MASREPDAPASETETGDTRAGFLYALAAYLFWGVQPFYMKAIAHIPADEIVAHRILWSLPLAGVLLVWLGRTSDIGKALRSPRTLLLGCLPAALITVNWGVYVWAIAVERTLETALGYYINPLFSVLLGAVVLGERLTRLQGAAIALAVAAVAVLTWETGGIPWVSIVLCVTWGFYALCKRMLPIGPAQGFFIEVLLLTPVALIWALWVTMSGRGHFGLTGAIDIMLLVGCGFVTATPLILYANGAKLLRLSTIAIMQYIAPTMIFLIAVFAFGEPFSLLKLFAFVLIWTALVLYTWSMFANRADAGSGAPTAGR